MALIRQLLQASPFIPFQIHTSGGRQYRVATADHAALNPRGTQVMLWFDDDGGIALSGLHITAVEQEVLQPG